MAQGFNTIGIFYQWLPRLILTIILTIGVILFFVLELNARSGSVESIGLILPTLAVNIICIFSSFAIFFPNTSSFEGRFVGKEEESYFFVINRCQYKFVDDQNEIDEVRFTYLNENDIFFEDFEEDAKYKIWYDENTIVKVEKIS